MWHGLQSSISMKRESIKQLLFVFVIVSNVIQFVYAIKFLSGLLSFPGAIFFASVCYGEFWCVSFAKVRCYCNIHGCL